MKRAVSVAAALLLTLCLLPPLSVAAATPEEIYEEQMDSVGVTALYDSLPLYTRRLMDTLGIDALSVESMCALQPQTVLSSLWELLGEGASGPLTAIGSLLGMVLLVGLLSSLQPDDSTHGALFRILALLAAVTPLLVPLWKTMARAAEAAESAAVFSLGFAPVYASVLVSQGLSLSAVSHQTLMLAASQGLSLLIRTVLMPLLTASLALGIGGAVRSGSKLAEVGTFVGKTATWLLGLALTVFVAMLSLQGVLAAGADSVGGRVMRFSVSGLVPIVGGSLSEALYTVRGCLSALRGTVGVFGIVSTVLIVLPTLLECVAWNVALYVARLTAELFSFGSLSVATETVRGVVRALIAVLASSALLLIVSVTLTVTVAGGG